jgi:hypothetical protein
MVASNFKMHMWLVPLLLIFVVRIVGYGYVHIVLVVVIVVVAASASRLPIHNDVVVGVRLLLLSFLLIAMHHVDCCLSRCSNRCVVVFQVVFNLVKKLCSVEYQTVLGHVIPLNGSNLTHLLK